MPLADSDVAAMIKVSQALIFMGTQGASHFSRRVLLFFYFEKQQNKKQ